MTTITIPLPEGLEKFVAAEDHTSVSEYVLPLIARTQQAKERASLEARLLAGVESLERGEGQALTGADWDRLRADVRQRYGEGETS